MNRILSLFIVLLPLQLIAQKWEALSPDNKTIHIKNAIVNDKKQIIAVGENGCAIQSNDIGKSWERLNTGTNVNFKSIVPAGNLFFALAEKGEVFVVDSEAKKWTQIFKIEANCEGIFFANNQTGAVSTQDSLIYITKDAGLSWQKIKVPCRVHEVGFIGKSTAVILGYERGVYISSGNFDQWKSINAKIDWRNWLRNVGKISEQEYCIAGSSGLFIVTKDAGLSWQKSTTAFDNGDLEFSHTINQNELCLIAHPTSYSAEDIDRITTIYISKDKGKTWKKNLLKMPYTKGDFELILDEKTMICFNGNNIIKTNDAGESWSSPFNLNLDIINDLNFTDKGSGYLIGNTGRKGKVLKTIDGGKSWTEVVSINNEKKLNGMYYGVNNEIYLTGKNMFYRTDEKFSSLQKNTVLDESDSIEKDLVIETLIPFSAKKISMFSFGKSHQTRNGGEMWRTESFGNLNQTYVMNSSIKIGQDTAIVIGFEKIVCKTTDKGATWNVCNVIEDHSAADYHQNDLRELLSVCATQSGALWCVGGGYDDNYIILKSTDLGENWNLVKLENIDQKEKLIYIKSFSATDAVIVAESGAVYTTKDGGRNWIKTLAAQKENFLRKVQFVSINFGYAISGKNYLLKYSTN